MLGGLIAAQGGVEIVHVEAAADDQRIVENDARRYQFAVMEFRDLQNRLSRLAMDKGLTQITSSSTF